MQSVFLWCIGLGTVVLLLQVILTLVGFGDGAPDLQLPDPDLGGSPLSAGLELLSVRSIAAAVAVFGASGMLLDGYVPGALAAAASVLPAVAAAAGSAWLTRLMLKADSSGSLKLEGAVGAVGTVYLTVPADRAGTGIVQFPLQGRTVELRAYTTDARPLETGTAVLVISVDTETEQVEVVSTSNLEVSE